MKSTEENVIDRVMALVNALTASFELPQGRLSHKVTLVVTHAHCVGVESGKLVKKKAIGKVADPVRRTRSTPSNATRS